MNPTQKQFSLNRAASKAYSYHKSKFLSYIFRETGVHGLEGMAHPPLGDVTVPDVKVLRDRFIYNGGLGAHEQTTKSDDEVHAFYRTFFDELNGWHRFIFGAACQTGINTPWRRITLVRDLCRRYGGWPGVAGGSGGIPA